MWPLLVLLFEAQQGDLKGICSLFTGFSNCKKVKKSDREGERQTDRQADRQMGGVTAKGEKVQR